MMEKIWKFFGAGKDDGQATDQIHAQAELDNMLIDHERETRNAIEATKQSREINGRIRETIDKIREPFAEFETLMAGGKHVRRHH